MTYVFPMLKPSYQIGTKGLIVGTKVGTKLKIGSHKSFSCKDLASGVIQW